MIADDKFFLIFPWVCDEEEGEKKNSGFSQVELVYQTLLNGFS